MCIRDRDCATGDFVTFIDSDDYIEQGMLSYMNELTNNLNVELFMFNYYLDEPEGRIRKKNETINDDELIILNKRDLVRVIFEDKLTAIIACTKLYSMKLFVDTRFPMKRRFEDLFIFFDIVDVYKRQEEEAMIRTLCGERHHMGLSRGLVRNGSFRAVNGPLAGKEALIRKLDLHKRIAVLNLKPVKENKDIWAGIEILPGE